MSYEEHLAECPNCGVYGITPQSFEKFLTPECEKQLARMAYAPIAVLHFEDGCPVCRPEFQTEVCISLLRPKRSLLRRSFDRLLRVPKAIAYAFRNQSAKTAGTKTTADQVYRSAADERL